MIIFDPERGEYVDTETGEVIEDRVVDQDQNGEYIIMKMS